MPWWREDEAGTNGWYQRREDVVAGVDDSILKCINREGVLTACGSQEEEQHPPPPVLFSRIPVVLF